MSQICSVQQYGNPLIRAIQSSIEGGIIALLEPGNAIDSPSGSAHAVFTTVPGFLVSRNFLDGHTIVGMSMWLHASLFKDKSLSDDDKMVRLQSWINAAQVALDTGQVLDGWTVAKVELLHLLELCSERERAAMKKMWQDCLRASDIEPSWVTKLEQVRQDLSSVGIKLRKAK